MAIFYFFFFLCFLCLALLLKQALFWVYLWQVKGYRYDRFKAEYGARAKVFRFWISAGGRTFRRPVWTLKAIAISLVSFFMVAALFWFQVTMSSFSYSFAFSFSFGISVLLLLAYFVGSFLLIPLLVTSIVGFANIPSALIKALIYSKARRKRMAMRNLVVIGITGSYGKSSTKELLARILSSKYKTQKTPDNINSEIGIAKFVINDLRSDTEMFVVEMGAYRIGEIQKSCRIVKPTAAILTGLNEQHLALFGSFENIKWAKFELIESLPAGGFAVFNGENKYCVELAGKWAGEKVLYRADDLADIMVRDMPRHYRLNLAGAVAVAKHVGMNDGEINNAIMGFERAPVQGRFMARSTGRNGVTIIDDGYSENPDGVLAALDYLSSQKKKTSIIVMPCIIELGDASAAVHERIGRRIADVCDQAIITTPDHFSEIQKGAGGKALLITDPAKIIERLRTNLNADTAILLEGRLPGSIIAFLNPPLPPLPSSSLSSS